MQFNRRQFIQGLGLLSISTLAIPSFAKAKIKSEVYSATTLLMGTYVSIKAVHHDKNFVEECFAKAFNTMQEAESILTRHKDNSALAVLNSQKSLKNAPQDLINVAKTAKQVETLTKGAFNPSVFSVLEYLEKQNTVSTAEINELYKLVQSNALQINANNISLANSDLKVSLDGIAKGYIVDLAYAELEKAGLTDFLINAGGDMRAKGVKELSVLEPKPWKIAIEDPYKSRNYPATIALHNAAIATSGSYEKKFSQGFSHLIKPNQESENYNILSVSVLAPTAILADSLATAFSCMKTTETLKLVNSNADLACLIITQDNIIKSNNWV